MLRIILLCFLCSLAATAYISTSVSVSGSVHVNPDAELITDVERLESERANIAEKDTPTADALKAIIADLNNPQKYQDLTDAEVEEYKAQAILLIGNFIAEITKFDTVADDLISKYNGTSGANIDKFKDTLQTVKSLTGPIQTSLETLKAAVQNATTKEDLKNILQPLVLSNLMRGVETLLTTLEAKLGSISSSPEDVKDKIDEALRSLKAKAKEAKDAVAAAAAELALLKAQATSGMSAEKLLELKDKIQGQLGELLEKISAAKVIAEESLRNLPNSLNEGAKMAINAARKTVTDVITNLNSASDFLNTLKAKIAGASSTDLKKQLSEVISGLRAQVEVILESTKALISSSIVHIAEFLDRLLAGAQDFINSSFNNLRGYFSGLLDTSNQYLSP